MSDDFTTEERRLNAAFARLVPPPGTRRWDAPAASPRTRGGARGLRRVPARSDGRRLAPLGLAGLLAAAVAVGGLAFGARYHRSGDDGGRLGGTGGGPAATVTPATSPGATAPPGSPAPSATATAPAAAGFACAPHSGGVHGVPAQLTAVRVAHQPGFDRVTFEFVPPPRGTPLGNQVGIPEYAIVPQSSAAFSRDASGAGVQLDGAAALRIVFRDASGVDLNGMATYSGSGDLRVALPTVREVTRLGDNERVLTWGVGLATAQCVRVSELTSPLRVVVDIVSAGS